MCIHFNHVPASAFNWDKRRRSFFRPEQLAEGTNSDVIKPCRAVLISHNTIRVLVTPVYCVSIRDCAYIFSKVYKTVCLLETDLLETALIRGKIRHSLLYGLHNYFLYDPKPTIHVATR